MMLTLTCAAGPLPNDGMVMVMLSRGQAALDLGNISGARRLFMLPAQAGNAEAERCLAETYDPVWLAKHNAHPLADLADPDVALTWYQKAADGGDAEAAHYLGRDSSVNKTP